MIWINSIIGHITSSLLVISSREYKTIVRCCIQFATTLHSDRDIPHYLHAEGFLTKDIYDDVINPRCMLSESDKACELVSGIRRRVEQFPTNFHKLLSYLRKQDGKYDDILKLLEETYSATELPSEASCDSQSSAPAMGESY